MLINTDGMALIGPGSEWFWSMLQFLVVGLTLFAIYRQLRLQRSQTSIEQLGTFEREWLGEPIVRAKVSVLVALRDGADRASVPDEPALAIISFWERIGLLVRAGHIDGELLFSGGDGVQCEFWWTLLMPWIGRLRATEGGSTWTGENFEWIARTMAEYSRRAGLPATDDATVMHDVRWVLAVNQDRLAAAIALRTAPASFDAEATPKEAAAQR